MSSARWSTRAAEASSGGVPYACERHMHPRPIAETSNGPNLRVCMIINAQCPMLNAQEDTWALGIVPWALLQRNPRRLRPRKPRPTFGVQPFHRFTPQPRQPIFHREPASGLQIAEVTVAFRESLEQ